MYILFLFLAALFLISIFATNWPVKQYHYYLLRNLAVLLGTVPEKNGMFLSNVYSQINTIYRGKKIKIRFMEASVDSLKANSGLELRVQILSGDACEHAVLEFYPIRQHKHEWGEFKRFHTGDSLIDSQWFILTNNLTTAGLFWNSFSLQNLLQYPDLGKVLLNQNELIIQFKNYRSAVKVKQFIDELTHVFPD